jgi:hypothetical protein
VATVITPYWEYTTALMQMLVWWKNFEDGNTSSPGLFAAEYLEFTELSLISYVKPSVADPDPVLFYPPDPGSGMEQWSDPG